MVLVLPPPQATCNRQAPTTSRTRQQLRSFLRLPVARPTSIAGSDNQVAYRGRGVERRPLGVAAGSPSDAVWAVVVIVSVVVAAAESGVTVGGLNEQLAMAGNPVQAKLITLVTEP